MLSRENKNDVTFGQECTYYMAQNGELISCFCNKDLICSPHALQALAWLQNDRDDPAPKRNWLGGMFQELFDTGSTIQDAIYRVKKTKKTKNPSSLKYFYV